MNTLSGVAAALVSTASWALGAVLFKKLGEKSASIAMTTVKALLSTAFLGCFVLIFKITPFVNLSQLMVLFLSGVIGIAIGDTFFFASLKRLSPIVLSILLFAGPDIFSGLLALIVLKEMPTWQIWIGIFLILSGLACLLFPIKSENSDQKTTILGIVFAFASLICTALSMVIVKPVLIQISTIVATMYRMLFGGLFLFVFAFVSRKTKEWEVPFKNKNYSLKFLGTVLIVTFGGFWLSLFAIKNCDIVVASTLMTLEPLLILLYMVLFGKYKAKLKEYIGIILSIVGILLIAIFSR